MIGKVNRCFSAIKNKYYFDGNEVVFSPLHVYQYTIFLYFLANTLFVNTKNRSLCDRIYALSKIISGMDLYYEVEMPDIFFCDHPVGSVIGRGKFGNYFSFVQGCTVGNNKGIFPEFGERVVMLSDSKVLGKCKIGSNVIIAANTYIKDTDIPDNSIVFGSSPDLCIKTNLKGYIDNIIQEKFMFTF